MPELTCCQLTCHSLHVALGLAGWGEAGAGEPAWPLSCGRGSEQVGSCLSQDPCSRSAWWNVAVESVRQIQIFCPLPVTFTEVFAVVLMGRLHLIGSAQYGGTQACGAGEDLLTPAASQKTRGWLCWEGPAGKRPAEKTLLFNNQIWQPGRDEYQTVKGPRDHACRIGDGWGP